MNNQDQLQELHPPKKRGRRLLRLAGQDCGWARDFSPDRCCF